MDDNEFENGLTNTNPYNDGDSFFSSPPPSFDEPTENPTPTETSEPTVEEIKEEEQQQQEPQEQQQEPVSEEPKPTEDDKKKPGRKPGSKMYTAEEVARATGKWKELRQQVKDKDDQIAELTRQLEEAKTNGANSEEIAKRDEAIEVLRKQLRVANVYQTKEFQELKKTYNDTINDLHEQIGDEVVDRSELEVALLTSDREERRIRLKEILEKCKESGLDEIELMSIRQDFMKCRDVVADVIDKKESLKKTAQSEREEAANAMKKSGLSRQEVNKIFGYDILSEEDGDDIMPALAKKGKALRDERDSYKKKNDELNAQLGDMKKKIAEMEAKQNGELKHLREKDEKRKAAQPSVGRNSAPPAPSSSKNAEPFSMSFDEYRRSLSR